VRARADEMGQASRRPARHHVCCAGAQHHHRRHAAEAGESTAERASPVQPRQGRSNRSDADAIETGCQTCVLLRQGRRGQSDTEATEPGRESHVQVRQTVGEQSDAGAINVRPGLQCKPRCTGSRGLSDGVRTPDCATISKRGAATGPPVLPSQCNIFTRSESQGQGPLYGQLGCATRAGRVEKRVVCCVVGDSINDERSSRCP